MKRLTFILKTTGIILVGIGVLLGFLDLIGAFVDQDKEYVITWATTSKSGLSIDHPGARKFLKAFPPTSHEQGKEITHLTKQVIESAPGGAMVISINYMYSDLTRSVYVANLPEVKEWARATSYPWIAWSLSFLGFTEVLVSFVIELRIGMTNKRIQPTGG